MLTVHKPLVDSNASLVNLTVSMSNDIECSFAFDDSCGRMQTCGRNYLLITQGEEELYNIYALAPTTLKTLMALALLDNFNAMKLILDKIKA